MVRSWIPVGLLFALTAFPASAEERAKQAGADPAFCVAAPHDQPCSTMPLDQTEFSKFFVYSTVEKVAQDPFDRFSWQMFIALNWPADRSGGPLPGPLDAGDPDTPRVWEYFTTKQALMGSAPFPCAGADLVLEQFHQSDGSVLVDQSGNFVLYETRANAVAQSYVTAQGLSSAAGQHLFWDRGNSISFPRQGVPSILVKTAWRPILSPQDGARYLTRRAAIRVRAEDSATDTDLCLPLTVGLVGMHIVSRTESGNGDEWLWSTFEQVDNVPAAGNARDINSLYSDDLFPGGCAAPAAAVSGSYAFFDPDCPDCRVNLPPEGLWRWADRPPFARRDGVAMKHPPQIVRCWKIFDSTAAMNDVWRAKLSGSVWANYQLISTQWRGGPITPIFEHGEVPRYLSNTTLETYIQTAKEGSCMGCHAGAATAAGQPANFTFLLRDAR